MKALVSCVFILTLLSVSAQESYFGIKTGYIMPQMNGENESTIDMETFHSSTFGMVICSEFDNSPLGLTIEPGYVLKGGNANTDSVKYRLHYANMPVLIDYYPLSFVKLNAGLEPAFLMQAQNTYPEEHVKLLDDFDKRFELSATLGVSLSISYFLDVNFRYSKGLTKIRDYDAYLQMSDISNDYTQISLTWKIAN